ncbi:MAG: hypothetical protein AAGB46_16710, partial [Verrucomicrobiota bacterium]
MDPFVEEQLAKAETLYFITIPRSAYHLLAKRVNFYFDDRLGVFEAARYRQSELSEAVERGCRLLGCHDIG